MAEDIFEQFINSIKVTLEWQWELQAETDPEREVWVAWAANNPGRSAMVCRMNNGTYRVSVCIEYPVMDTAGMQGIITMELALARESANFASAHEAMLWVEEYAWNTLIQMAEACLHIRE